MEGKQIYFTKDEIDSLCEFINALDEICADEETYAYWLKRIGPAVYKILDTKKSKETVNFIEENLANNCQDVFLKKFCFKKGRI